jgi:hypothetical protein
VLVRVDEVVVHWVSELVFFHCGKCFLEWHVVMSAVVEVAKPVHDSPKCLCIEAVGEVMDIK